MKKSVTLDLPEEFIRFCKFQKVDPEVILKGFISDLACIQNWAHPNPAENRPAREPDGYQSHGSDERRLAYQYYERVGYGGPFFRGRKMDGQND
jgi:hypothetical protein